MALYDNKHWLLSHIRDSFISSDDTGMCEIVMIEEDIPKHLKENGALCFPGYDSDDEDLDAMAESYEIQMDMEYGRRPRSNTAQRLEKMEMERKKSSKIKNIKCEQNPIAMSEAEILEMFQRKDFRKKNTQNAKKYSLLSEQLEKTPHILRNPFIDYAKFEGNNHIGVPVRKYRIFMSMLEKEERSYPIQVVVIASAKVQEFIGLICYKYASEHLNHNLKENITKYGLYIGEDDGEVDWDFPCLDPREVISKFEFSTLCLVEMRPSDRARHEFSEPLNFINPNSIKQKNEMNEMEQKIIDEDLAKMKGHTTALEAPLYQLYRVYIVNKVRAKTEIHLGISGDKIEIDPVITGKGTSRFWNRQRAASYQMDNIAWCELTENKGSKSSFTLVYSAHPSSSGSFTAHAHSLHQSISFKSHDFEAEASIAEEIVRKINHILELRSSSARKEFVAHKERKSMRRRSFHLHR